LEDNNMANTTFSGPVISKNGFITTGPGITKTINSTGLGAAGLPLTVNAHAGRILNFTRRRWYLQVTTMIAVDDGAKKAFFSRSIK
jgi:hypothetical protein